MTHSVLTGLMNYCLRLKVQLSFVFLCFIGLKHEKNPCDSIVFQYFTVEMKDMTRTTALSRGEIQHFKNITDPTFDIFL